MVKAPESDEWKSTVLLFSLKSYALLDPSVDLKPDHVWTIAKFTSWIRSGLALMDVDDNGAPVAVPENDIPSAKEAHSVWFPFTTAVGGLRMYALVHWPHTLALCRILNIELAPDAIPPESD